jgi:hypothetical protein
MGAVREERSMMRWVFGGMASYGVMVRVIAFAE